MPGSAISINVMTFEIMTEEIVVVTFFAGCTFAHRSTIASMFLLVEFGVVPVQFIKLILGLLYIYFFN